MSLQSVPPDVFYSVAEKLLPREKCTLAACSRQLHRMVWVFAPPTVLIHCCMPESLFVDFNEADYLAGHRPKTDSSARAATGTTTTTAPRLLPMIANVMARRIRGWDSGTSSCVPCSPIESTYLVQELLCLRPPHRFFIVDFSVNVYVSNKNLTVNLLKMMARVCANSDPTLYLCCFLTLFFSHLPVFSSA